MLTLGAVPRASSVNTHTLSVPKAVQGSPNSAAPQDDKPGYDSVVYINQMAMETSSEGPVSAHTSPRGVPMETTTTSVTFNRAMGTEETFEACAQSPSAAGIQKSYLGNASVRLPFVEHDLCSPSDIRHR